MLLLWLCRKEFEEKKIISNSGKLSRISQYHLTFAYSHKNNAIFTTHPPRKDSSYYLLFKRKEDEEKKRIKTN